MLFYDNNKPVKNGKACRQVQKRRTLSGFAPVYGNFLIWDSYPMEGFTAAKLNILR